MATKLDKPLKREVVIDGKTYTATISPDGVKLVPKGCRNGPSVGWRELIAQDKPR